MIDFDELIDLLPDVANDVGELTDQFEMELIGQDDFSSFLENSDMDFTQFLEGTSESDTLFSDLIEDFVQPDQDNVFTQLAEDFIDSETDLNNPITSVVSVLNKIVEDGAEFISEATNEFEGDYIPIYDEPSYFQEFVTDFGESFSFIGDESNVQFWDLQEADYSCAIACQKNVIDSLLLTDLPEEMLSDFASKVGIYDPYSGTSIEDLGKVLDIFNIPNETVENSSLDYISSLLSSGEKVIAGIDSNLINGVTDMFPAGHAVQVVGVFNDSEGPFSVLLNDPGRPDGQGLEVPVELFKQAWNTYGNVINYTRVT
jgi:hypothetical protein